MINNNKITGEIILYQPDNSVRLEVMIADDTVWLNRNQLAQLFDRDVKTIGKHVNNALTEELKEFSVVAKFATTASDGKTYQIAYYNLDMILSIGYRVKSQKGIQFRIWSNRILKDYLLKGFAYKQQVERFERFSIETNQRLTETEYEIRQLKLYIELFLNDFNDINEDTCMQLELIKQALADLQSVNTPKPYKPVGFIASIEQAKGEQ
jgi:hypothetical protein